MKYIGESAIRKLISLIKGDLATKQNTITASGLLKSDGVGTITAAETQEATLVDVPNGLLKGDGTNISAAVAGTDYMAPASNQFTASAGQVLTKTSTGAEWTTVQSGGSSLPIEVDLSDSITLSPDNLFASSTSTGSNKSIGEKIKQAALGHNANVIVMLKFENREPEKVTLQMFGTQSTLNDGTLAYSLTGTYVWDGTFPIDIMIGTILHETDCTIIKRIESLTQKPIYDPVDKPDTMSNGAFLRWSGEQKKWAAEIVPVEDLQQDVNQTKDDLVRLENLLIQIQDKLNQGTVVDNITVNEINNMIVEYFENKTVLEVEG